MPSKQSRYPHALGGDSPRVILAHVPGAQGDNVLLGQRDVGQLPKESWPALLISYVYLQGFQGNQHKYAYRDWMLDSGAFSAYNSGGEIDIHAYVAKCHELLESDPTLVEIIALDVIGSGPGSLKNAIYMKEQGLDVIPVFHIKDDWDILKEYCKGWDKVGISCRFGEPIKESLRFYEQCFARVWPKKLHSFGWQGEKMLLSFPLHSSDSADWEIKPCLAGGTLVSTDKGLYPIVELVGKEDVAVLTYTGVAVPGCSVIHTGMRETLKVKLKTSQTIDCTPDHPILTDRGWCKAGELGIGDMVRVPHGQIKQCRVEECLVDEMLGWMVGDGSFLQLPKSGREVAAIIFADVTDDDARKKLMPTWDEFVGADLKLNVNIHPATGGKCYSKISERNEVIDKLHALGFKFGKSPVKELPTYIFTARSEQQLAFLRGLFSADGTMKFGGTGGTTGGQRLWGPSVIVLTSRSRVLLSQVQILLMEFGIHSHINWSVDARKEEVTYNGELAIVGYSALAYMTLISFNIEYKRNAYRGPKFYHKQKSFYPVTSIEKGIVQDVYDVVMPSIHHFVANGMVVHNCQFGTWRSFAKAGSTQYLNVRGSKQNLRCEVEWYLDLEKRLQVKWKKEMEILEAIPRISSLPMRQGLGCSTRLVVGTGRSIRDEGINAIGRRDGG